ncbi:hypothetical protein BDP27DRAFT_1369245, partial [Rhodocollybia butyracea]
DIPGGSGLRCLRGDFHQTCPNSSTTPGKAALKTFIYLSTATLLLFVIVTVTIIVDLIFTTHIFKKPTEPIDFSGYAKKLKINIGCRSFAVVVSDAFLILNPMQLYRSYILYNSRLRVVALPLLVFVLKCGTMSICYV